GIVPKVRLWSKDQAGSPSQLDASSKKLGQVRTSNSLPRASLDTAEASSKPKAAASAADTKSLGGG
ncbi:unnamed protein product, partial [Amoebophrya sp. A25]